MSKQLDIESPEVSIIILNWNNSALTLKCVESVQCNVSSTSYEVIIVDNGSDPLELMHLKEGLEPSSVLISLDQNLFFGGGCNIGAKAAHGRFLLFLNNDVLITPGAVDELVALYKSSFSPGAIGPKFLYPNGLLQEAGAFALPNGRTFQQGKGGIGPDPHFASGVHIVDYCSAACLLIEKDAFIAYEGFDSIFEPAYFEDVDLCLRLRAHGLYTYYASDVTVYHQENATSAALWTGEEIRAILARNSQIFLRRWSSYLETRLQDSKHILLQPLSDLDSALSEPIGSVLMRSASLDDSTDCVAMLRCAAALEYKYDITLGVSASCSRIQIDSLCAKIGLHLSRYRIAELTDTDISSYDHTISFPGDAFDERLPLSTLKCMRMLFDTL